MGSRARPRARELAQCTALMERVTIRHITPSAPTPLPPARRPLVLRLTSAAQDKRWRTSSAPRSCRRRSALLPASRRGGRPPCKQHERLVSPSPRPAASSRTSPSILYASTAHRGVAVTSRRRATAPPMRVAEVSSPAIVTRDRPVRLSIARLLVPPGPRQGAVAANAPWCWVLCQSTRSSRCCGERGYEGLAKRTL